jgi:PAS domain S-box-containing protein
MNDRAVRLVYALFLLVFAVLSFAAFSAWRTINRGTASADWVNHTHAAIYALDRVVSSLAAGDGAVRTYVWTGDRRDVAQARGEFNEMSDNLESLRALTRDDASVRDQVREIGPLVEQHAAAMLALAKARSEGAAAEGEALMRANPGVEALQEVKRRAARIRAEQFELLSQHDHEAYVRAQKTHWVVGLCMALDLALLAGVAWLIRDDIAARRRLTETLRSANEVLETKVKERTRELASANADLTSENLERKWAAQALDHQLRYHQLIVNATTDLVFMVTKTLAVMRVNPAVALRTGWTDEEVLGRPLGERLGGIEALELALRSGREIHSQPGRLLLRGGKQLPVSFSFVPLRDNDKVVGGVVLVQLLNPAQDVPSAT